MLKYPPNIQRLLNIFVFLLILCGISFFQVRNFDPAAVGLAQNFGGALCLIGFIIFYINGRHKKVKVNFGTTFSFFLVALILSNFLSALYWNQNMFISLTGEITFFYLFFYFVLHNLTISKNFLVSVIKFIGLAHALFYIINLLSPEQFFGLKDSREVYGIVKSIFPGRTFMYISYFIILESLLKKFKVINLLTLLFFIIVFLLMGRRIMFLSIFLGSLFLYYKYYNFNVKRFLQLFLIISLLIWSGFFYFENAILEIFTKTEDQINLAEDYIRVQSFLYYFFDFSPNLITNIFGNGFPSLRSEYGQFVHKLEENRGFWMADIGLIGFHIQFGVLAVIAICSMLWKFITIQNHETFVFAAVGVFFIPMALLNVEIVRIDTFLAFSILMYLSDIQNIKSVKKEPIKYY